MKLTPRQRKALHHRIALALAWDGTTPYYKDAHNRSATVILDAIEDAQFSSMALRRGIDAVIQSLDPDEKAS